MSEKRYEYNCRIGQSCHFITESELDVLETQFARIRKEIEATKKPKQRYQDIGVTEGGYLAFWADGYWRYMSPGAYSIDTKIKVRFCFNGPDLIAQGEIAVGMSMEGAEIIMDSLSGPQQTVKSVLVWEKVCGARGRHERGERGND